MSLQIILIEFFIVILFLLSDLKNSWSIFKEKEFNSVGYVFLYNDKVKEAIAIFELNVKEYPDSWNVYDSLGEALMKAGDHPEAVASYQRSLELDPDNDNARTMIRPTRTPFCAPRRTTPSPAASIERRQSQAPPPSAYSNNSTSETLPAGERR